MSLKGFIKYIFDGILIGILIMIIVLIIIKLSSLNWTDDNKDASNKSTTDIHLFEHVGYGTRLAEEVVYDKETKVMYVVDSNRGYTMLVNADGTPRLYNGE